MPHDEFPRSEEPYLFTDKPDPTVVECVRVREVAETRRQAHAHRAKLLATTDVQWILGVLGLATIIVSGIVVHAFITRNRPPAPVIVSPEPPPHSPATEETASATTCVESLTHVFVLTKQPYSCPTGATFDFKPDLKDTDYAYIHCTCPSVPEHLAPPAASSSTTPPLNLRLVAPDPSLAAPAPMTSAAAPRLPWPCGPLSRNDAPLDPTGWVVVTKDNRVPGHTFTATANKTFTELQLVIDEHCTDLILVNSGHGLEWDQVLDKQP